jgi:hypothetical protein
MRLSKALKATVRQMPQTNASKKCSQAQHLASISQENGWTLEQTANGKTFDAFKLSRA